MKVNYLMGYTLSIALILLCSSCKPDEEFVVPNIDKTYVFERPSNFPNTTYTFNKNPVTQAGFELGRKLFYDPTLSRDNSISCNSCHIQSTGFADSQQHPLSIGVDDRIGIRNAPSLTNLAFYKEFFWDGGVTHLDFVAINAIESSFEMDEKLANVISKLNNNSEYKSLFKKAFKIDSVTSPFMLQALSQFMIMMVSSNSKYDKYIRGEGQTFREDELLGLQVFQQKCASCHSGELFTDMTYRNNGIDATFTDKGRGLISELNTDNGTFRVPSLRNVALTAPYMHNAKFKTLDEVLEHYNSGVIMSETLDSQLQQNNTMGIPISVAEKKQIIAFLNTLTDKQFTSDSLFFNP